jgi:hypothetical protein
MAPRRTPSPQHWRHFDGDRRPDEEGSVMKKELTQYYGGRKPRSYLPAHNHIAHAPWFAHGLNGFRRFWIPPQWVADGSFTKCPCGWNSHRPEWKTHYAVRCHAKHWRDLIKKHGSVKAAQAVEGRRIARWMKKQMGPEMWRDLTSKRAAA